MKEITSWFSQMWQRVTDKTRPMSSRIGAAALLLLPPAIVVALAVLVWQALPVLMAAATLFYLIFGNSIERAAERKHTAQANQQANASMEDFIILQELASRVIGPVLSRSFGVSIEPEDLAYWGVPSYGAGYYFSTPDPVADKDMRRQIRVQVARRLSAMVNIPPAQLLHDGVVRCGSNCVYIRADVPAIRENLLMSARSV